MSITHLDPEPWRSLLESSTAGNIRIRFSSVGIPKPSEVNKGGINCLYIQRKAANIRSEVALWKEVFTALKDTAFPDSLFQDKAYPLRRVFFPSMPVYAPLVLQYCYKLIADRESTLQRDTLTRALKMDSESQLIDVLKTELDDPSLPVSVVNVVKSIFGEGKVPETDNAEEAKIYLKREIQSRTNGS
ncbi:MAG TPA: hypothetical protein PKH07_17900 [bacterium]|nr:hypothetical protein [bacterium]